MSRAAGPNVAPKKAAAGLVSLEGYFPRSNGRPAPPGQFPPVVMRCDDTYPVPDGSVVPVFNRVSNPSRGGRGIG